MDNVQQAVLKSDATGACSILEKLTQTESKGAVLASIRGSKGVAFLTQQKAGFGLAYTKGTGFVLRRLEGEGRWSAPAYFTARNVSAGFVVGHELVHTMLVIRDDAAVERFQRTEAQIGTDFTFAFGPNQVRQSQKGASAAGAYMVWQKDGPSVLTFSIAEGSMIEASIKTGVLNMDNVTNADLLGHDATPEKILQGQVAQPVEFAELYDLLNKLSAAPA